VLYEPPTRSSEIKKNIKIFIFKWKKIFYLIVAVGGFLMYVVYGMYPFLPNDYLSEIHWVTGTLLAFFCYSSFYLACKISPGSIENSNLEYYLKKYKFDGIMFMDHNKCPTCKLKKWECFALNFFYDNFFFFKTND